MTNCISAETLRKDIKLVALNTEHQKSDFGYEDIKLWLNALKQKIEASGVEEAISLV